ncbi:MAG: hypothetical protein MHM6MM_003990 [Cercozoa sp. M6MM]
MNQALHRQALSEALAGMIGGTISTCCTYPLDKVKTRLQVQSKYRGMLHGLLCMTSEEGIAEVYSGVLNDVLRSDVQNFSYFYAYNFLKLLYLALRARRRRARRRQEKLRRQKEMEEKRKQQQQHALNQDSAQNLAELYRRSVARQRNATLRTASTMSLPPSAPSLASVREIYVDSSTVEKVTNRKRRVSSCTSVNGDADTIPVVMNLLIGIAAGCVASTLMNPLNVVSTRIQTRDKSAPDAGKGTWGTLSHIVQSEGVSALWRGILPTYVLTANPAIQFLTFDRLKAVITTRYFLSLVSTHRCRVRKYHRINNAGLKTTKRCASRRCRLLFWLHWPRRWPPC